VNEDGFIALFMPNAEYETAIGQALFLPHLHSFTRESAVALGARYGYEAVFWSGGREDEIGIIYSKSKSALSALKAEKDSRFFSLTQDEYVPKTFIMERLRKPWGEVANDSSSVVLSYHIVGFIKCPETRKRSYALLKGLKGFYIRGLRFAASLADRLKLRWLVIKSHGFLKFISGPGQQVKSLGYVRLKRHRDFNPANDVPRLSMDDQAVIILK
jgi:hypothetical protein